jgi:NAD(P)-dependent dehydrogenase (short-subunit alcohol dehydrogenase family)
MGTDRWATGRTFLITGASSGMGAATAVRLGAAGANVLVQGRDLDRTRSVADEVAAAGGTARAVIADLEQGDAAAQGLADAVKDFGPLHGLVLNASLFEPLPLADTTAQSLARQWTVNVAAHYFIAQAAVSRMEQGASIVFVSSTTAHVGFAGCSAYAATKGAVEALARTLAVELAPQGIRVNTVAPGFVRTPMLQPHLDANEGYEQSLEEQTPSARIGEAREIGELIAFLLSDKAAYVNGATITADGGWTAR